MSVSLARAFCTDDRVHVFVERADLRTKTVKRSARPLCDAEVSTVGEITPYDIVDRCDRCEWRANVMMPASTAPVPSPESESEFS